MLLVKNVLLEEEVTSAYFSCDLKKCKGACCTFPGEYGAPVLDSEVKVMHDCLPQASKYLSDRNLKYIDKYGIVEGSVGNYTTVCINKRDCVFVYYEGDIALCALERAYFDGLIPFRKPISCHLFPIRVANHGGKYMYYQRFEECQAGRDKGTSQQIHLFSTVKDALIRAYGEQWYVFFEEYIAQNKNQISQKLSDEV